MTLQCSGGGGESHPSGVLTRSVPRRADGGRGSRGSRVFRSSTASHDWCSGKGVTVVAPAAGVTGRLRPGRGTAAL